jgi:hypothetical protein
MGKKSIFFLCLVVYGVVHMSLWIATLCQRRRLMEWFRQWNSQVAINETPFDGLEGWTFFFSKRAIQVLRPHPFLWRQRQLFVLLSIGCMILLLAGPVLAILGIIFYAG